MLAITHKKNDWVPGQLRSNLASVLEESDKREDLLCVAMFSCSIFIYPSFLIIRPLKGGRSVAQPTVLSFWLRSLQQWCNGPPICIHHIACESKMVPHQPTYTAMANLGQTLNFHNRDERRAWLATTAYRSAGLSIIELTNAYLIGPGLSSASRRLG